MKVLEGNTGSPGPNGLGVVSVPSPVGPLGVGPGVGPTQGPIAGDGVKIGDGQGQGEPLDDGDYVVDIYMQQEQEDKDTANESAAKISDPRTHIPVVQVDGYVPSLILFSFLPPLYAAIY